MKKTEIIYTRITKPNNKFLDTITQNANTSRATCLDGLLSFMRENMSEDLIQKEIAKRRNKVRAQGRPISRHTS